MRTVTENSRALKFTKAHPGAAAIGQRGLRVVELQAADLGVARPSWRSQVESGT